MKPHGQRNEDAIVKGRARLNQMGELMGAWHKFRWSVCLTGLWSRVLAENGLPVASRNGYTVVRRHHDVVVRRPHSTCKVIPATSVYSGPAVSRCLYQGDRLIPWSQKLAVFLGQWCHLDPPFTCADKDLCKQGFTQPAHNKKLLLSLITKTFCHKYQRIVHEKKQLI